MSTTGDNRSISVGRDAQGNAFVTGDNNNVHIVVYQTFKEILAVYPGQIKETASSDQQAIGPNPYMGLSAFHEEDAKRFFGREEQTNRLWESFRILHEPPLHGRSPMRLLSVLGPSGSGKSSIARAGLVPELARRPLPGWSEARVAVLTPGSHPLEALANVLARIATGEVASINKSDEFLNALRKHDEEEQYIGLRRIAAMLPEAATTPLIVLVDQFEEIYSLCSDSEERNAFVNNLLCAVTEPGNQISLVLTLRTDFLGATQKHLQLNSAIAANGTIIPAMNRDEIRRAICEPAKLAGRGFDEATVDLLIRETEGREGAMPLLEFALTRIWEGLRSGFEPAETLNNIGGVGGALAVEAQRIYKTLPEMAQRTARRVFLGLVQLGEGTQDTRRRTEINNLVAHNEDAAQVRNTICRFADPQVRLITLASNPDGQATAEVTHEALFEHWQQLRTWLNENREHLRFQRRVDAAARHWETRGRPTGLLWRPPDLADLRDYQRAFAADMTALQLEFYAASKGAEKAAEHRDKAAAIMAEIDGRGTLPSVKEFHTLRRLAESEEEVRLAFIQQLIDSMARTAKGNAGRFRNRYEYIIHVVVGLEFGVFAKLKRLLVDHGSSPCDHLEINIACAEFANLLNTDEVALQQVIARNYMAAVEKTADATVLSSLNHVLDGLVDTLSSKQAAAAAQQVLSAMQKTTDSDVLGSLEESMSSLSRNLTPEQAATVARQIVAAIEEPTNWDALHSLGAALNSVSVGLSGDFADTITLQILAAIEKTNGACITYSLGEALECLSKKLSPKYASFAAKRILVAMEETKGDYSWPSLESALDSLIVKLPADQATTIAQQMLAAMKRTVDSSALAFLGRSLSSMCERLTAEQATTGIERIMTTMGKATDPLTISSLSSALSSFGERLPRERAVVAIQQLLWATVKTADPGDPFGPHGLLSGFDVKIAAEQITAALAKTNNPNSLDSLAIELLSLTDELPVEQAAAAARQVVAGMEKTTNSSALNSLGKALGNLVERLRAEQTAAIAKQVVAAMNNKDDLDVLCFLCKVLGNLGKKLPAEQATAAAKRILRRMEMPNSPDSLSSLCGALGSLGDELPADQAAAAAKRIVAAMRKTTEADTLSSLGSSLGSLGEKLPAEQATVAAHRILGVMEKTTEPEPLSSLCAALGDLGVKLQADQVTVGALYIMAALKEATDANERSFLANALEGLANVLPAEQAIVAAQEVLAAMEKDTDEDSLSSQGSALSSLANKLDAEQAASLICQILNAIEAGGDSDMLSLLGNTLESLSIRLHPEQAMAVDQRILSVVAKTNRSDALCGLNNLLGHSGQSLPAEQVAATAQQVLANMEKATDEYSLNCLSNVLGKLVIHMEAKDVISTLKSVSSVGQVQNTILEELNEKAGGEIAGNLWNAVRWAKEHGVDVENVPRWPLKEEE